MKGSLTWRVANAIDKSFAGLSFGELSNKMQEPRVALQKALSNLYAHGRINRAQDDNGIVHYSMTVAGSEWVKKSAGRLHNGRKVSEASPAPTVIVDEVLNLEPAKVADVVYEVSKGRTGFKEDNTPRPATQAWDHLVREAEERGFARGYVAGCRTHQRAAFDEGKRSVVRKLEVLLCSD